MEDAGVPAGFAAAVRTWRQLLAEATDILGSPLEARRIAEEAAGQSGAAFVLALDDPVPARAGAHLAAMVERRAGGEPLQYALGRWSFRTLDLMVDRRVLIPRPETEVVAGVAIEEANRLARTAPDARIVAVDLGTGSGALGLSIAAEVRGVEVWATDVSHEALEVARANLCGLGGFAATRVRLAQGSWFAAVPAELRGRVDLIVANPPYIADDEVIDHDVEAWEPRLALRSGPSGLECLASIIGEAPNWLAGHGVLVVELSPLQADEVRGLAARAGFASAELALDLTGRERVLVARR